MSNKKRKLLSVNVLLAIMFLFVSCGLFSPIAFTASAQSKSSTSRPLLAYYAFEDGNNLGKDNSGNGNHLKLVNVKSTSGAKSSDGVLGNGANFDGTSVLTASTDKDSRDFTDGLNKITIDFWYKRDASKKGTQRLFSSGQEFDTGGFMFASSYGDNSGYLHPTVSNTTKINPLTGDKLDDNWCYSKHQYEGHNEASWNHVTMVAQSTGGNLGSITLYINGRSAGTTYYDYGSLIFSNRNIAFTIGGWLKQGLIIEPFVGDIDEVKIYSAALNEKEIWEAHNDVVGNDDGFGKEYWNMQELIAHYTFDKSNNLGEDTSGFRNHLFQRYEGKITQVAGEKGKAAHFNGTDILTATTKEHGDRVTDFSDELDSATFAYWLNPDTVTNRDDYGTVLSNALDNHGGGVLQYVDYSRNKVGSKYAVRLDERFDYSDLNYGNVKYSSWKHYAVTIDNNAKSIKLYENGTLVQSATFVGTVAIENYYSKLSVGGKIGETGGMVNPFEGSIDDMRIYSYALSANQVKALAQKREPEKPVVPPKPVNPVKPGEPTIPTKPTIPTNPTTPTSPTGPAKPVPTGVVEDVFASYPFDLSSVAKAAFHVSEGFSNEGDAIDKGQADKPEAFKKMFVATTTAGSVLLVTLAVQLVVYLKGGSASKSHNPRWRKGGKP